LRMVVSNDSMKKATAINHGSSCLLEEASGGGGFGTSTGAKGAKASGVGCVMFGRRARHLYCASKW
jgi:hypothetical protein